MDAYLNRVSNMDKDELHSHLRRDYHHPDQLWPDYLDYLDEWKFEYRHKLSVTRKDFIYRFLAVRNQKIQCGDHYHQFSTEPSSNELSVHFPRTDTFISPTACWYKTILKMEDELSSDELISASTFTTTELTFLHRFASVEMVKQGLTPTLLSFEDFKNHWWGQENTALPSIEELKIDLPAGEPQWLLTKDSPVEIVQTSELTSQDHGLHTLLATAPEPYLVFKTINKIRDVTPEPDLVTPSQLATAMENCNQCSGNYPTVGPTYPGVYYAPPGNGKTTAARHNVFCGVDTDWLLKMSDFNTVIAPFLAMDLPVITNQYNLATNSGEKFIGNFNPHALRTAPTGKAYTSPREIQAAKKTYGSDLTISLQPLFFSQASLHVQRLLHVYNTTRNQFLPTKRSRLPKPSKHSQYSNWCNLKYAIEQWPDPYRGKNYQQNLRKRRKK